LELVVKHLDFLAYNAIAHTILLALGINTFDHIHGQ
jgi:hypothetical protein